jgi:prepilin-type N-terminal cleavage/methylation domain-containing protein
MKTQKQDSHHSEQGFTIIEIMIATLVFSMVLLVITVGVLSFSRAYYRGVQESATQNTARNITETVERSIQFGTSPVVIAAPAANGRGYFCAGGYKFVYSMGQKYVGAAPTTTNAGLYMMPAAATCPAAGALTGGQQLLGENMTITDIKLTQGANDVYTLSINIVYGDIDLICKPGVVNCNSNTILNPTQLVSAPTAQCKLQLGSEYCAVATLTTTIQKRIAAS